MHHKLISISVNNFCSIVYENFPLNDYTPLVGYNNAGKTTLLRACKWIFRKWSLSLEEFNNPARPVEMIGVVSGITEEVLAQLGPNHRESIRPYLEDGRLIIKRIQNQPGESIRNIRLYVKQPVPADPENPWVSNPAGIDNAIDDLFPEPIMVTAVENIEDDVSKSRQGTTIGKLIAEIIQPIEERYGGEARDAMAVLKAKLDANGNNRAEELIEFDRQTNEKLNILFPSVSIRLHVPTPELKEVFKSGTIRVYEDDHDHGRDISSFGSGAQRSIQMALIRQLAEVRRGITGSPTRTLLLIDEPELYLHPQAIEQVRAALKQLSVQGYQIIFATHSAQMIKADDVKHTLLVRKDPRRGTCRRKTLEDAITEILAGADQNHQLEVLFSLSNASQILFSDGVILTEGKTENKIFDKLFEVVTGGETLGTNKCALIKQDGGGNIWKTMKILKAMGVPAKGIVDLDYAFTQGIHDGTVAADDTNIIACKQIFIEMAEAGQIDLDQGTGLPINPKTSGKLIRADAFCNMARDPRAQEKIQVLHEKLKTQGLWLWKGGTIETHLGLEGKTPPIWARFIASISNGNDYTAVIPDCVGVEELVAWVRNIYEDQEVPAEAAGIPSPSVEGEILLVLPVLRTNG